MRILLVDDDPIFSDVIISKLAKCGLSDIIWASSAAHALQLVDNQDQPFDCYLLDIMMEGMDGIELCHHLRQRDDCKTAPMIMMTASQETSLMGRAFQAGATDFLRKPLNDAELAGRITTAMLLVEITQQERQSRAALQAALSPTPNSRSLAVAERICFSDVDSMMDYYELENHLLRLKDGFYQISVFRIRLPGFERRFRNSTRETTLEELHTVSKKITHAVSAKRLLLTYIGRGRFICCIIGRQSKVSAPFQHRLQNAASEALNALGAESGGDTDFLVKPLNDNPLLAKAVAIDLVRQEFDLVAALAANTPPETLLRKRCLEPGTGPAFVPPHVLV